MRALLITCLLASGCYANMGGDAKAVGDDDGSDAAACVGPLGPPKSASTIAAMTTCCTDLGYHAHCLPSDQVPAELAGLVDVCPEGGSCIPDEFLATGAATPPQQCTAFGGAGVCLSQCVPDVAVNAGILKPDVCANPDDLCVPCISPLDNMPTGACDLLELAQCVDGSGTDPTPPPATCDDPATCEYEASCPPLVDPSALTACGADAHCLDPALVPDAQRALLATCTGGAQLCVPDTLIRTGGKFTPKTCDSVAGAEGRCMSLVLPDVAAQADLLPQDTCTASERCTPCYSPIDGTATGACSLACDPGPTQPAVTFDACCHARGRCIPDSSIPDDQEGQLDDDSCAAHNLCVPDQILSAGPYPACTAHSLILGDYTGVCLDDCLHFGLQGIALVHGSCSSDYKCAPCELNGAPTGAPGCLP